MDAVRDEMLDRVMLHLTRKFEFELPEAIELSMNLGQGESEADLRHRFEDELSLSAANELVELRRQFLNSLLEKDESVTDNEVDDYIEAYLDNVDEELYPTMPVAANA